MSEIVRSLIRLAEEVMPQIRLRFERSDKIDDSEYNKIHFELQRFVSTVRGNENVETTVTRTDDADEMLLMVGFSDHDAKKAIVEEVERQAKRLAKKAGIKVRVL